MLQRIMHYAPLAQGEYPIAWIQAILLVVVTLIFVVQSVRLSVIDIRTHRLPDRLVLPLYGLIALPLFAVMLIDQDFVRARNTAYGTVVLFGFYYLLRKLSRNTLGFGDVKLAGVIGMICAFVAPMNMVWATVLAFLLGGVGSLLLLISKKATATTHIPFGPFMLAGALLALCIPA
ncbi:MAG: A24 family peptidase [Rothia sp. (in: high G+C Gram-positive bacteria)]|nr:A24 family peptidase [Rothia sp. (in: high G+C Gram-positive bacteria)]